MSETDDALPLSPDSYVTEMHGLTAPTDLVILAGYLSGADQPGRWRLYTSLELDAYVEFEESDVFRHEAMALGPVEGTVVWLAAAANVVCTYGSLQQPLVAEFLSGDFMARFPGGGRTQGSCPHSNH